MKILNRLDDYFYSKPAKELLMFCFMIVLSVGFVIYYFVYPSIEEFAQKEINLNKTLKREISSLKMKRNIILNKIQLANKKISQLKLEKISLKKKKEFYDELANLLDFAQFNQSKWGDFIKNMVLDAKSDGLVVLGFKNSEVNKPKPVKNKKYHKNNNNIIEEKMRVALHVTGEYKNLLYFIYQYENNKALVRFNGININSKKNYELNISLYGYTQ